MADESTPLKFFTPREAAQIAEAAEIDYVPQSERRMLEWLSNRDPYTLECLSQPRRGRGGGRVYHWTIFPERLWPALDAEISARLKARHQVSGNPRASDGGGSEYQRSLMERTRPSAFWGGGPKERRQRPTFNAPDQLLAAALANAAGLAETPDFLPIEVRSVDRCLVRFDRKKFFSRDLNRHHKTEVCVTTTPSYPDLLWVFVYEAARKHVPAGPGALICVADARANVQPYFPLEFQQAAEAKRAEGHARRRERKALDQKATLETGIYNPADIEIIVSNAETLKGPN